MPGGTGAIVKLNINTIAMIGTTASNDSFNFSDNFVRYKFNKYSCLSVLIIYNFLTIQYILYIITEFPTIYFSTVKILLRTLTL